MDETEVSLIDDILGDPDRHGVGVAREDLDEVDRLVSFGVEVEIVTLELEDEELLLALDLLLRLGDLTRALEGDDSMGK